jgi:hypothetical protein
VAEPWTDDLAVLGARSRNQLRSLAATRAQVFSEAPAKPRLWLFRLRPVLTATVVLGLVGGAAAAAAAYVVTLHPKLDLDYSKSAPEMEAEFRAQLAAQHVTGTEIRVKKFGDHAAFMLIMGGQNQIVLPELTGLGGSAAP